MFYMNRRSLKVPSESLDCRISVEFRNRGIPFTRKSFHRKKTIGNCVDCVCEVNGNFCNEIVIVEYHNSI